MLDNLSQLVFNIYEAFTVAFFVRNEDSLRCLSSVTFAKSFDRNRTIPIEGTLPGWVVKHNEPLVIPNFDKDENALGYYNTQEGIKSFMGYPMEDKGVIVIDSKKKWVFTDKEKKILGNFASVIQQELERERLYQEMEERVEELFTERRILSRFHELNSLKISVQEILKEASGLSDADFCFIGMEMAGRLYIYEVSGIPDCEFKMRECSPANSIASIVMEGGRELLLPYNSGYLKEKPLFFPGEAITPKQFFGFPLITGEMVVGTIGFVSLSERRLKETSISLLRDISTFLSLYYTYHWMKENVEKLKDFEPMTGSIQFSTFLNIIEKAFRKEEEFSVISVKLSNIDLYNRKWGYEFTNNVIKKVFQIIRYCVGENALITRKGGGHFYVFLKGSSEQEAKNMLKILNYTILKSIFHGEDHGEKVAIESHLASFPDDGISNIWDILDRAGGKTKLHLM